MCCARQLPLTLRYIPVRLLALSDSVAASCQRGGHCCRDVHVPLTPFDVLRLARALSITTTEVLTEVATLTEQGTIEVIGDPVCPFLNGDDCSVYAARPDSCRMYPFWRVVTGEQEWIVERHTCAGCWAECRSEGNKVLREVLHEADVAPGRRAEEKYQGAIRTLEQAGVPEESVEAFMTAVYDLDNSAASPLPLPVSSEGFELLVESLLARALRSARRRRGSKPAS